MGKNEVILSGGSIPWFGIKQALNYTTDIGYDGLEIIPSRKVTKEIENALKVYGEERWSNCFSNSRLIKSIHQSWRLDIGLDKEYKIAYFWSWLFTILRLLLFPKTDKSQRIIRIISEKFHTPVTVHNMSEEWTHYDNNEFSGGIHYEIIGVENRAPREIKEWLSKKQHKIVVDMRDDQSLLWAKKYGFDNWRSFWEWIGIQNIAGIQLTLIGVRGLNKILNHAPSLAEEQLLWLHSQKWQGSIIVEVNPLILFFLSKGKMKQGLQIIANFIRQALDYGKNWSA